MLAAIRKNFCTIARDESGSAVSEYAVVIGCVIVVVAIVLSVCGSKVMARWESVADKLDGKTAARVHMTPEHAR